LNSLASPEVDRDAARPVAPRDISVVGVRKTFDVTRALDGCSFSASRGEIHAIVGGNGCGKSTLAKVLSGVLPPDSGQVLVFGQTPTTPHEARAAGIATVFQEVLVADESSVVENLFLGADPLFSRSMPQREKVAAADALMRDLTGLPVDPRAIVGTLPLGIKQWITIGRALLRQPRALILDESSAALDLDSTQRLFAKLRQLRDAGSAIIIVTHRIAELIEISDRATVLRDGRDVGVLERSEITEKNLLQLMTGKAGVGRPSGALRNDMTDAPLLMKADRLKVWSNGPDVAFHLREGEILGIAGLDGQGQSEFVRILAGVDRAPQSAAMAVHPASGLVPIRGLREAAECGVSYVSGDRKREGIFPNLSIFENLLMPRYRRSARAGHLAILDGAALRSVFDWETQKLSVRMGDRAGRITSLSGGNQQKILIGRAFALNPTVLVLNDPARGVDVGAKNDLYEYLKDFARTGKAVVYLSSEIEELVGLCARVLVFRHGGVFDEFSSQDIQAAAILQAMFGQGRSAERAANPAGTQQSQGTQMKANQATRPASMMSNRSKPFKRHSPCGLQRSMKERGSPSVTPKIVRIRPPLFGKILRRERRALRWRSPTRTCRRSSIFRVRSHIGSHTTSPPMRESWWKAPVRRDNFLQA